MNRPNALAVEEQPFINDMWTVLASNRTNTQKFELLQRLVATHDKAHAQSLLSAVETQVVKVPPCNCKHARFIVGEQKLALNNLKEKYSCK